MCDWDLNNLRCHNDVTVMSSVAGSIYLRLKHGYFMHTIVRTVRSKCNLHNQRECFISNK